MKDERGKGKPQRTQRTQKERIEDRAGKKGTGDFFIAKVVDGVLEARLCRDVSERLRECLDSKARYEHAGVRTMKRKVACPRSESQKSSSIKGKQQGPIKTAGGQSNMRKVATVFLLILLSWPNLAGAQGSGERIKVSYTATAMSLLPVFLGVRQGIYEAEGFQVDLVRISGGNIMPSALLNRELDYSSSANISAIAGLPIKIIAAMQVKTPLSLVVRSEIKNGADLKGKTIAVARPGSLTDETARDFARHYGLNPDRGEITTLGLGDHAARILALQTNRAQGAILDAPSDIHAQTLGFNKMYALPDPPSGSALL